MKSVFRKVAVSERLPELEKWVTTIDSANEQRVYRRIEVDKGVFKEGWCWTLREPDGLNSPNNNLEITHWLEEVELTDEKILQMFNQAKDEDTVGLDRKDIGLLRRGFELGIEAIAE